MRRLLASAKQSAVHRRVFFPICVLALTSVLFDLTAQGRPRVQNRSGVPRVGTIKDYPATGLMTGCGNLYFSPPSQSGSTNTAYVFLARGDGSNAWMNLNGRDVRLRQIKVSGKRQQARHHLYRWGDVRISVVFENFKPADAPVGDTDPMFRMKITLRRGRAVRTVRAIGDSDC